MEGAGKEGEIGRVVWPGPHGFEGRGARSGITNDRPVAAVV